MHTDRKGAESICERAKGIPGDLNRRLTHMLHHTLRTAYLQHLYIRAREICRCAVASRVVNYEGRVTSCRQ